VTRLRSALWLPLFDELADPLVVVSLDQVRGVLRDGPAAPLGA
jgi:hypothetical protein